MAIFFFFDRLLLLQWLKLIIYISNFLTWLWNPYRLFLLSQLMFWMHAPIYFMFYSWHPFDMSKIILHEELYQLFGLLFSYDLQFVCFGNSFFVSCMLECILQHCFNYSIHVLPLCWNLIETKYKSYSRIKQLMVAST